MGPRAHSATGALKTRSVARHRPSFRRVIYRYFKVLAIHLTRLDYVRRSNFVEIIYKAIGNNDTSGRMYGHLLAK